MSARMSRPWWVVSLWVVIVVGIVIEALRFIPSGQVAVSPGLTGNLRQMVEVKNAKGLGPGRMLMVAVDIGTASEFQYLTRWFRPTWQFEPEEAVLGSLNINQYIQYNSALMEQSQWAAKVAGERLAGLNAHIATYHGALVVGILKTGYAQGQLKLGDVVTRIGSYPVTQYLGLRKVMGHFKVGQVVDVGVKRNGQSKVVPVKAVHIAGDADPALGILVGPWQKPIIPRPVAIHPGQIGGPSAGMMFALEIYGQITGNNIAHGKIVAGTGEISPNGQVVAIGGVQQKVVTVYRAGARVFVVPQANYQAAEFMAKKMGYHMKIYGVKNLKQALQDFQMATS